MGWMRLNGIQINQPRRCAGQRQDKEGGIDDGQGSDLNTEGDLMQ